MNLLIAFLLDVTAHAGWTDVTLEVATLHHRYRIEFKAGEAWGLARYWDAWSQSWEREDRIHRNQLLPALRSFKAGGLLNLHPSAQPDEGRAYLTFVEGGVTRVRRADSDQKLILEVRQFIAGSIRW